jgi:hypothetical protein
MTTEAETKEPVLDAPTHTAEGPLAESGPGGFLTALLVMLVVLVTAELFYRDSAVDSRLRKGANYITAKALDYAQLGGDIVVTGDSRMYHAINPAVMEETLREVKGKSYTTYNFGIPSGTTPIFLMVAHEAARHKPPPRVFILGVTPALFSCCDAVDAAGTQPGVTWSAVPMFVRAGWYLAPEQAGGSVFFGASRLLAFRTEVSTAVHDFTLPPPLAFPIRGHWSLGGRVGAGTQDARAKGRAGAYAELMDKSKGCELRAMPGRYLAEAIEDLKRAGVNVIVMGTPQARQLDWYHDSKHTYFEYIEEVKRVTSQHQVPFIDMNAPPGIESTDFMDGDHLSEPGTTIFTKYVAREIVAGFLQ